MDFHRVAGLRFPKFPIILKRPTISLLVGVVMLVPACVALSLLKGQAAYSEYLVLLLGLVWCADIGAYFSGRRFGRTKLHPAVSPGKSWAGVYGGLLVTLVFSGVWFSQVIGIGTLSLMGGLLWILFVIVMVFVSILGDLRSLCTSECGMSKTRVNYCQGMAVFLTASTAFCLLHRLWCWHSPWLAGRFDWTIR